MAVDRFRKALEVLETDVSRDAAIQRFEFCFELAWKAIQERAREEELAKDVRRRLPRYLPLLDSLVAKLEAV